MTNIDRLLIYFNKSSV